jgi:hypothetical protein
MEAALMAADLQLSPRMRTLRCLALAALALALAAPATAQQPDLAPWDGIWFKAKLKQKGSGFHVAAPGVTRDAGAAPLYVRLHFDAAFPDRLEMEVWSREDTWEERRLPMLYLAGTTSTAVVYFNQVPVSPAPVVEPLLHLGIVLRLNGTLSGSTISKGSMATLGGYFIEVDDAPGSDERFAGSVKLGGKTTTKLPADLPAQ